MTGSSLEEGLRNALRKERQLHKQAGSRLKRADEAVGALTADNQQLRAEIAQLRKQIRHQNSTMSALQVAVLTITKKGTTNDR